MVKKTVQATFGELIAIDAEYKFSTTLEVKIHAEIRIKEGSDLTTQQLQEAPIRLAIKELQKLLPADTPSQ